MEPRHGHSGLFVLMLLGMVAILILLPLLGVLASGESLANYLEFPPLTRHVQHAAFSWWAFVLFSAINLMLLAGIAYLLRSAHQKVRSLSQLTYHRFPRWGWMGLAVLASGWLLAWSRFEWFRTFQGHTFCLPWIGYILLVNALCFWRSNRSPLTDYPGRFLLLFPISAAFWWFFEYLNRFVQNWYYVGPVHYGPLAYTLFASLAFSTVLPAVLSTYRFLLTYRVFGAGLDGQPALPLVDGKGAAIFLLMVSGMGLLLLGRFPNHLFALVWVAPLFIITSMQALAHRPTLFASLVQGDWRPVITPAIAALVCGFFWEMWNIGSLARWEYAIPFVDRFHIFAMPVLGYGGYLPFGLECLVLCRLLLPGDMVFPWQQAA
jgi:hypothetical protein